MITSPYILFTRIPVTKNSKGQIFCDPLWEKDLLLHLNYIENLELCCPVEHQENTEGLKEITNSKIRHYHELKADRGLKSVLQNLLPNLITTLRACKGAKIAHSGGAGWAFPLSFYLLLFRPFLNFQWIIVIESSFWMLEQNEKKTLRKLFNHHLHKVLLKKCIKSADARIFTQSFYREYFLQEETEKTLVSPATWINKDIIETPESITQRYNKKDTNNLKIIFPTRLTEEKGILTVLDAIEKIENTKHNIHITIMGSGELEKKCQSFIENYSGNIKIKLSPPIDYGPAFFEEIKKHDLVLVPTLKQEQPRIIFDAFSQGTPVIGADTSGIKDITNTDNTIYFKRANPSSLAKAISDIDLSKQDMLEMALSGLSYAAGKTHSRMHKIREEFLLSTLHL